MYTFEAKTRIPCRPLASENIDLAYNKELIVDYSTGNIYVKDANGDVHNLADMIKHHVLTSGISEEMTITYTGEDNKPVTVTVSDSIKQLIEMVNKAQESVDNAVQEMPDSSVTVLDEETGEEKEVLVTDMVHQILEKIETLKEEGVESNVPENIIRQIDTNATRIAERPVTKEATIVLNAGNWMGSAVPYTQRVDCAIALANGYRPIVSVIHPGDYAGDIAADTAFNDIIKIEVGNGFIVAYTKQVPEVNISMTFRVDVIE